MSLWASPGAGWLWRLDAALLLAAWALLVAVWAGYPLVMAALAHWRPYRLRRTPDGAPAQDWPRVSVIVSAYNEAAQIEARIQNLWDQRYPAGRMEILVAEDGSSDDTAARVLRLASAAARGGGEGARCALR
ncbi:MAG: glycosyltransferase, partial [Terriglobales bacterium]